MSIQDVRQIVAEAEDAGAQWGEPLPHHVESAPEPYPIDALPTGVREAVEEVQRFTQAPVAMVASSALGALSLALQAHCDVERARSLSGPTSLFLLTVADSGERKTTVDRYFTKGIQAYEQGAIAEKEPEVRQYKADIEAWKAIRQGILDRIKRNSRANKSTTEDAEKLADHEGLEPCCPLIPNLLMHDSTPEALAFSLARRWPSAGVVSSEAGVVFGGHAMNKDSVMRNLGLLNTLWDGEEHKVERRTSESFRVRGARLTVSLQVQDATIREFLAKNGQLARGSGFLARFLISWPVSTQGFRLFRDAPESWPSLSRFNAKVREMLEAPVNLRDGALDLRVIPLSSDARADWVVYHDDIEGSLRPSGELAEVRDVAAKSADNAARIAALFHVFSHGHSAACRECVVGATRVAAWHLAESKRFLGSMATTADELGAERLEEWLLDRCGQSAETSIPMATVQKSGPGGLRKKDDVDRAVGRLEELGRARLVASGNKRTIELNPRLIQKPAAAVIAVPAVEEMHA